jgi:hypothetical protein
MAFYPAVGNNSAVAVWLPADNGLLMASCDPYLAQGNVVAVAGTVYIAKIIARTSLTITNIWLGLITAGAGTSNGCFVGLYSSSGTLLSGSADIASSLTGTTGAISNALTTPQAVEAGTFVWAAVVTNLGTTQPTLAKGVGGAGGSAFANLGLVPATGRFGTAGTLQTSLPASITPGNNNLTSTDMWMGVN